jgi:dUTPase
MHNFGEKTQTIEKGERLAQLLIMPKLHYELVEVDR